MDCGPTIVGNTSGHVHQGPTNRSPLDIDFSSGIDPSGGAFFMGPIGIDAVDRLRTPNGQDIVDIGFPDGAVSGGGPDQCVSRPTAACFKGRFSVMVRGIGGAFVPPLVNDTGSAYFGQLFVVVLASPFEITATSTNRSGAGGETIIVTDLETGTVQQLVMPADGILPRLPI